MHNPSLYAKRCRRCGAEKPTTEEYFPRNKGKGFQRICLECHQGALLASHRVSRNQRRLGVSHLQCRACNEVKPATAEFFPVRKDAAYGLARICRPCLAIQTTAKRATLSPEAKARVSARPSSQRDWQRARKARWIAGNKQRYLATARVCTQRRRARRVAAPGNHTAADIAAQYTSQRGMCWWCGAKLEGVYQVDHLVPLSRGGGNDPSNLVCACASCNQSKSNKLPHEWSGRLL